MTDPTEDRVVEAMARAMAIADSDIEGEWPIHALTALAQYRAFLAMQSVLMDLKLVQPQPSQDVRQCDHPVAVPSHYKTRAEDIVETYEDQPGHMTAAIATALSEAYAKGLQDGAGAHERVVARLRDWFRDPTYGNFEFVDFQAIMIDAGLAPRSSCNCFLYDQQCCDICQGVVREPQEAATAMLASEA